MHIILTSEPKFPFGQLAATPNAVNQLSPEDVSKALSRHGVGDWGDLAPHDWSLNDEALKNNLRLLSVYTSSTGVTFWIITEWDRSATTILLPEDS